MRRRADDRTGGIRADAPTEATADDSWPQYRYTATNNAVVSSGLEEIYTGEIATPHEVRATPTVVEGRMFVGNHDTGELQAYDLKTGNELWQGQAPNWVPSEMVYADGVVVVGLGNRFFSHNAIRGTKESGVLGLDAATGEERWCFDTVGEVMPTPAVVDGSVYALTGDHHIYELDAATGEVFDRTDTGHIVSMSAPAAEGSMLYFGGGRPNPYSFTAYDTEVKEIAWQTEYPETVSGLDDVPPAVTDGIIVTTTNLDAPDTEEGESQETHVIYAMDDEDGEILRQDELGEGLNPTNNRSGAPTIHDGTVYVGSPTTGWSYAYDLHSGEELWRYRTGTVKGAPVAQDDTVYIATTEGWIHALDTSSGQKVGERHLGGAPAASGPIIIDAALVVGSEDANVYLTPLADITFDDATLGATDVEADTSSWTLWLVVAVIALGVCVVALAIVVVAQARQLTRHHTPHMSNS